MRFPKFKYTLSVNIITLIRLFRKYILRTKDRQYSRKLLLKPDTDDPRDYIYKTKKIVIEAPEDSGKVNISQINHVYDQGSLGSCGLNACELVRRRILQVNRQPDFDGSRLFGYLVARGEDNRLVDSGVTLRDMFKAINDYGVCSEQTWPYVIEKFKDLPPKSAYLEAMDHQLIRYERIFPVTKSSIKNALYNHFPIVFGLRIYESFMTDQVAQTGVIPIPKYYEKEIGGHALSGFDYSKKVVYCQNSWGEKWGQGGKFELPWEMLLDKKYCTDIWVLYQCE